MKNPILTAKVGTNADQFPDILKMYVPAPAVILDMTYGRGVFWKNVSDYDVLKNDKNPQKGDVHFDFRRMPLESNTFDAVVFDPPYMIVAGGKDMLDKNYGNNEYRNKGTLGIPAVINLFREGMQEAYRLTKTKGIIIVKCMDFISGGRQRRLSIEVYNIGTKELGMVDEDMFVMVQQTTPIMRHPYQLHARKNHSIWWIFRKNR